jgi:single-strand DNA-binding protein
MNNVTLLGRLTKDIDLKQTTNGISVASFTLAVNRSYAKQGEERKADFISCVAWRGNAEFISRWFRKGDMLGVVGHIETRTYDDKNGVRHYATEIIVEQAHFGGNRKQEDNNDYNSSPSDETWQPVDVDMPF